MRSSYPLSDGMMQRGTDIVDSTRLLEVLGDDQWESRMAWHDRTLRACFDAQAGEEVKHEGDGFFVASAEPDSALDCAGAIQRALRDHRHEHGFAPPVTDRHSRRRRHRPRS